MCARGQARSAAPRGALPVSGTRSPTRCPGFLCFCSHVASASALLGTSLLCLNQGSSWPPRMSRRGFSSLAFFFFFWLSFCPSLSLSRWPFPASCSVPRDLTVRATLSQRRGQWRRHSLRHRAGTTTEGDDVCQALGAHSQASGHRAGSLPVCVGIRGSHGAGLGRGCFLLRGRTRSF